ncbi:hypothetical protein HPB50_024369 [Hyalomma asiaticum]|uniref:Uncharacterized protein n=1 Tax=Hyalomma asiaticum TaxID=266040 RepID=A0ACB7TN54_HYAAI|nr:hypothetical protein HPB50_024369 [Hyalomma asiaticum]
MPLNHLGHLSYPSSPGTAVRDIDRRLPAYFALGFLLYHVCKAHTLPPYSGCSVLVDTAKNRERYEIKTTPCGLDPFTLRAGDYVSDVDLWPRVDSSNIHEFLVLRTNFITREQMKSRKALKGHNFVTSGWVREPWVKKVAADTVMIVTQVNHSQSDNKPAVDVCTANALGANTCSACQSCKASRFFFKINR